MSCGKGFRTRGVVCINVLSNTTSEYCDEDQKPDIIESCFIIEECPITTTTIKIGNYC